MHCALIVVCDKALTFVVKCLASNIIADHAGIRNVSIIISCLKTDITDQKRPTVSAQIRGRRLIKKLGVYGEILTHCKLDEVLGHQKFFYFYL